MEHAAAPILIVDDDPRKRLALKAALSPLGLDIIEADSGEGALRRVLEKNFAVILLDVRMPDMDGFETAGLIRTQRASEMTPIIFITAFANDEISPKAKYVEGAVDFIFAPVPPEELRAKVSVFVGLFLEAERLAEAAREVMMSARHMKVLTDAAPIGIFRTDPDHRFVHTNPRWTEICGFSDEEALGRTWDELVASTDPRGTQLGVTRSSAETIERRFKLCLDDSIERVVVLTSEPLHEDDDVAGWVGTLADVTAESKAEEERSRFRALVQNSRDVIAVIDGSGTCTYISPGVVDVGGFSPAEVVGTNGIKYVHPEDRAEIVRNLEEIVSTPGATQTVEVRTQTKAGGWIWIEIRAANRLEDPSIEGIVLNYHDITDRRAAGHRLAQSEKLLAEGQALSHVGSFTWNMRTDELAWSDEQFRLLGFHPGSVEPSFDGLLERIHPEDRDAFLRDTTKSSETGAPFELDVRVVIPDGPVRWIYSRGEVVVEAGLPDKLIGMSHDITDRKLAEDERLMLLAQQKDLADQLRMLLDSTGEGIYGVDDQGICTFMNKAGAALFGGTADKFVGQNIHELTHHSHADGSDYPAEECAATQGYANGKPTSGRGELRWRLDGTTFPVDFSSHPIGGEGSNQGAVVAFQDVTVRQGMEQKVRQSEKLFRGAFDAALTGIALIAADGLTYVDVNRTLCEMLGYSKPELLELDWPRITHPDDRERNRLEFDNLMDGRENTGYINKRYVRKDGEIITVEINDSVVRSSDGSPMYFVTHVNNVTERDRSVHEQEKLETQLVQAQKMEAVGQLAGGVAHDFNNILSVILNFAQFAAEGLESDDERLADIKEISKAGEKAAVLVHQLLAFSRKEIVEARVIDINEIVTGIYQILTRSLGEDIVLDFEPQGALPSVIADPGRIEQVLLNLVVNARDAMPEGGTLKIATGLESIADGDLPSLVEGDYVRIAVSDSGIGMDAATIERVFEPFFTTKPSGEGTGMGLSSAYGIVEQAGGALRVESKVGVGTVFTVYLPPSDALSPVAHEEEAPIAVGGAETILLVEDEDAVRELVSRILRKHGYEVLPYSSGPEALEYYRLNFDAVDLLLTDVVMPKMSGGELSEQATSIDADLKILFMSGYTDALIAQRGVLASDGNFITKPFNPEKLLTSVRSMLDEKVVADV